MKQRFSIFYLIKGKAGKLQQRLAKEVGPKFGENYLIENPLPAHITLKAPFDLDNLEQLEKTLINFVNSQKVQGKITIKGFGNFRRFVAFMNTKFSQDSKKIQKELIEELKKIKISIEKFDIKYKPHATISYGNTKETFDKIWNYLNTLEKPEFELVFDNISLMRKVNGKWEVYREFKIR